MAIDMMIKQPTDDCSKRYLKVLKNWKIFLDIF